MDVLVVGAGVAGLTLAAKLGQQGVQAAVVERGDAEQGGYAIGLYPLGSSVLRGLGSYDRLVERSLPVSRYELRDRKDRVLQAVDMSVLTGSVGPMLMVDRSELLALLEEGCTSAEVQRGTTVTALRQTGDAVEVDFDHGGTGRFDIVVGCDGVSSRVRELAFGAPPGFDSGWLLWTWWAQPNHFGRDVVNEWWGAGWFFGAYPSPGRVMCAAGGPERTVGHGDIDAGNLRQLLGELAAAEPGVDGAIADLHDAHAWPMRDVRSRSWVEGRIALCGDAAAGFLPTAGVGASNAMRAAAGLADELSRAGPATVPLALELYEKRCRKVVERNQTDSRRLARAMFVGSPALAWARDRIARRYPAEKMLSQIIDSMRTPF